MKKVFLTVAMVAALALCFALCISATVVYQTPEGETVFSCEKDGSYISSYSGAFPKTDADGNALIWYVESKSGDVVTVKSFKALGETGDVKGTIDKDGKYSVSGIATKNIVSINLPDNSGIKLINIDFNGGYTGTFPRDSHILFAYLPNTLEEATTNGGGGWTVQRFFQYTPILECYFSDLDTTNPNHMKTIGNFDFYGCRNMRVCVLPNGITTIYGNSNFNDGPAFRECYRLTEITIPNSVTYIGARAFENSGLVTIRFGANTNVYNADLAFNNGGHSLRYVYMPNNNFSGQYLFNTGKSDMVFFYAGDYDDYVAAMKALSSNNARFTGATPILWDSTKDDQYYKNLATSENKCYVVYGYSPCMAFYGGHTWKGESNVVCKNYFDTVSICDSCEACDSTQVKESIAPIFAWKGYSACTFGTVFSMVQGYQVNYQALNAYMEYVPDFEYGFIAAVNKTEGEIAPMLGGEGVVSQSFNNLQTELVDIKITGIPAEQRDILVIFCLYAKVEDSLLYLDNNATSQSILGQSYNGILN